MTTIKEKYGYLPTSVWNIQKSKTPKQFVSDNSVARDTKRSESSKYLPNLSFSEFNPDLAKRIIEYWSNPSDLILDPFAGRSTRMVITNLCNRSYLGYEISSKAFDDLMTKKHTPQQRLTSFNTSIDIKHADGCSLTDLADESVDMVFTCPPYWDLEKYESCTGQLSDCSTYTTYLSKLNECLYRCNDVLKRDKFAVFVVADFRKDGFKCLHKDLIDLALFNKFRLWDIVINVLNSPFAWCQIGKCEKQRYTSKTHEYILVFKK